MTLLSSLTNRIFLASALPAVVSIGVAIYVVNGAVTRQAEEELRRSVEEAATLVEQQRNLLFEQFAREARLVADLPKLKAAVATEHAPTVQPIAADYQLQMGADLFVVTTPEGAVLAEIGPGGLDDVPDGFIAGIAAALEGHETTWFWPGREGILQAVSVPIWIDPDQPIMLGSLSVGFNLDARIAQRFKQLTQCEIAFASEGRVQVSTVNGGNAALETLLDARVVTELAVGDDDYVAVARPLTMAGVGGPAERAGAAVAGAAGPIAIVLRSRTERLRFLRPLQTALAGTAVVALLAAVLLSYLVARTVTRPLAAITAAMREVAATGDLDRRAPVRSDGWGDEDTRLLATTFNTLTASVRRFQQEAAQRERLSSLGRLSTVVAHEIRNPLMIIKTALRALRRPEIDAGEVRAAAADIDEEVDRLNRLVTEVLDFARPIKFAIGAVDLNQLCREAAAAAEAGDPAAAAGPRVALVLDPRAADVRTDRERLRLVLVNLLGNARHAVMQKPAAGAAGTGGAAAIELVTTAPSNGTIGIIVRDRGIGIQTGDLAKVFDPYFTTKRTGSGLGLAIAKNIVEGLGGRIAVHSEVNVGTEIRVELPRRAPDAAVSLAPSPWP